MNYVKTNKTEDTWNRKDIRDMEPGENTDSIIDRIRELDISGMSFQNVVDYYRMNLASWRRFYKQDDTVNVNEVTTEKGLNSTRLQSMNIIFYITEKKNGGLSIKATLSDFSNQVEGGDADIDTLEELVST